MASELTIYHNPRCSKSRATLAILMDAGLNPTVVEYIKEGINEDTLKGVLTNLGLPAAQVIRRGEAVYKDNHMNADEMSDDDLVSAIARHPILLERPIVSDGTRAVIGRPPENVRALL
ncbi:MAG: arsenate reductase (glutaredoxin) [Lysobacterales bacterium]